MTELNFDHEKKKSKAVYSNEKVRLHTVQLMEGKKHQLKYNQLSQKEYNKMKG
jgi:hypothetical protein